MIAPLGALALVAFAANATPHETPAECPQGTHRATTNDPFQPFKCVKEDEKKGFDAVTGPEGFKAPPKCPRGTRPTASTSGLQKYRCVRVSGGEAEPDLISSVQSHDEPAPEAQTLSRPPRIRAISAAAYRRYEVPAEMSFDYPRMLLPRDGWKEEVPTLSFTLDDGSPGKPVMITITKVVPSQPTYIDIEAAANKDKEWQGAKDGGLVATAGVKARVTFVPGESRTAYIPRPAGAYYAVVYSAPVESYDLYLGAFNRLLKTMKLARNGK